MLEKPENGWTQIQIGDYSERASYLTDVPINCLRAFIFGLENNLPVTVNFDAEGWEYIVVSDNSETHIITNDDDAESTHVIFLSIGNKMLVEELIVDIESNLNEWVDWECYSDKNEIETGKRELELNVLLSKLKTLI